MRPIVGIGMTENPHLLFLLTMHSLLLQYVTMMNHPFSVLLPLPMNLFGTLTMVHLITLRMMLPLSMTKSLILDPKLSK